jgi:hypothetical protein
VRRLTGFASALALPLDFRCSAIPLDARRKVRCPDIGELRESSPLPPTRGMAEHHAADLRFGRASPDRLLCAC